MADEAFRAEFTTESGALVSMFITAAGTVRAAAIGRYNDVAYGATLNREGGRDVVVIEVEAQPEWVWYRPIEDKPRQPHGTATLKAYVQPGDVERVRGFFTEAKRIEAEYTQAIREQIGGG